MRNEINMEQAEAMFHRGLDVSYDAIKNLGNSKRDPTPAEIGGLLTGIIGFAVMPGRANLFPCPVA